MTSKVLARVLWIWFMLICVFAFQSFAVGQDNCDNECRYRYMYVTDVFGGSGAFLERWNNCKWCTGAKSRCSKLIPKIGGTCTDSKTPVEFKTLTNWNLKCDLVVGGTAELQDGFPEQDDWITDDEHTSWHCVLPPP